MQIAESTLGRVFSEPLHFLSVGSGFTGPCATSVSPSCRYETGNQLIKEC